MPRLRRPILALAFSSFAVPGLCAAELQAVRIGGYSTGAGGSTAAEISAFDPVSKRLFTVSDSLARLDIVDLSNLAQPALLRSIDLSTDGSGPTSVGVAKGLVAVAMPAKRKTAPGAVLLFDVEGRRLGRVEVGAQPDMVSFSPDGTRVLVAIEGEPEDYCEPGLDHDAEGGIAVIDVSAGPQKATARLAGFSAFTRESLPAGVRVFGPHASVAQDLEPEFLSFSPDGRRAWATLQENNAIAELDVAAARITRIIALGATDHRLPGHALDASDLDGGTQIRNWPVSGLYEPDAIRTLQVGDELFLVTANEGDPREWNCYAEPARVAELKLDPQAFPDAAWLQKPANLGRLMVSRASGDPDGDGDYDQLFSFGSRSFSIWTTSGERVWDSGDQFERILAERLPDHFNSDNIGHQAGARSDDKGPEPEGVTVGVVDSTPYVFVGLERGSAVMAYDVSDPRHPVFARLFHARVFAGEARDGTAGDVGPEGLRFVSAKESPNGQALLLVSNEVSGTVGIWELRHTQAQSAR